MYRPRIIPVLLLKNAGLVKSVKFSKFNYVGDPLNSVRLFNEMKADELMFLDIEASAENRSIDFNLVKNIAEEANMPFSVGGGIKDLSTIQRLISNGVEKVVLTSIALANKGFVSEAVEHFGSSTIAVCINVKKSLFGGQKVYNFLEKKSTNLDPVSFAMELEKLGVGEIILQSVNRDGTQLGYDIELIKNVSENISIPLVALGGAGDFDDLKDLNNSTTVNGLGAGSLFVYNGKTKSVLINYPEDDKKQKLYQSKNG